jgi:hypothetical protein
MVFLAQSLHLDLKLSILGCRGYNQDGTGQGRCYEVLDHDSQSDNHLRLHCVWNVGHRSPHSTYGYLAMNRMLCYLVD